MKITWNQDVVVNEYWLRWAQEELTKAVACMAKKERLTQGDAEALEHLAKAFRLTDTDLIIQAAERRNRLRAGQSGQKGNGRS